MSGLDKADEPTPEKYEALVTAIEDRVLHVAELTPKQITLMDQFEDDMPLWGQLAFVQSEVERMREELRQALDGLDGDLEEYAQAPASDDQFWGKLRPASAAHVKLEAAVLLCLESGVTPESVRRFVEVALTQPEKDDDAGWIEPDLDPHPPGRQSEEEK
jgi:hypothetical protein